MTAIQQYLQQKVTHVEKKLEAYIAELPFDPTPLRESIAYSLMAGGKRLRPVLTLATAEALGAKEEDALPFACAIEMIHTYSLIHDDLPSMDDDDYRRGKLTNHKVYGEAMAILAGDALLTKAFGIMAESVLQAGLPPETGLEMIREGSIRAGAEGMVGGQVKDILAENKKVDLERLQDIHRAKTGDLITFSVRLGARIAGASSSQLAAVTSFAERIGLAFQIQDDILDVVGEQEKLGKPTGSDEEKNKSTYPALLGLEPSRQWVRELITEAKGCLTSEPGINASDLLAIADYLVSRDR
ncbi:polyprenyl synthetase family protein [Marininema halotolerans]|uniref:Farnesyl diphosphate synthase n=1 Tax=Marininema halotolerans TaxID=1155944 RepID=A0A1I6TVF0_9BACL|nr:farnesyl diphosphate synthase [Marininema halotolerans]SFS93078.1 geranylgeranyl diphosphate synthase, type II [Marininema halotolerans]